MMGVFEVSADYLLNDEMDSYEVNIKDKSLSNKIKLIDSLEDRDRESLSHIIDTMLTKQRMK